MDRDVIILNERAGTIVASSLEAVRAKIEAGFAAAGAAVPEMVAVAPENLEDRLRREVEAGRRRILVGGGDGTVATAAGVLRESETALGILPMGTFNLMARDLGMPLELAAAAEALATSSVIPGNHDLVAWNLARRAATPLHRYKRYISADLQPVWEDERLSILGIDTTRRAGLYLDWSRGAISGRRLRAIRRHFREVDSHKVKVLVTHHPFAQKPDALKRRRLIDTPAGCLEALASCGVELILSGHFHHGHVERLPVTGGREILSVQAGTATSRRLKGEPNSFNWITVTPAAERRLQIETLELQEDLSWAPEGDGVAGAGS